jgi:uncharacterized protein (DUF1330 family)
VSAYFVIHNRIVDNDLMQSYIPRAMATMAPYGAELLVLTERSECIEGDTDFPRTIVFKFESREKAEAWYQGEEYQAILPDRLSATEGFAVLVDGFEG